MSLLFAASAALVLASAMVPLAFALAGRRTRV